METTQFDYEVQEDLMITERAYIDEGASPEELASTDEVVLMAESTGEERYGVAISAGNLRSGPTVSYPEVHSFVAGARLTIITPGNTRTRVRMGSRTGWISNSRLERIEFHGRAISAGNLRSGPTASHSETHSFPNGAYARVVSVNGTRSFVRMGSRTGWMSNSRLAFIERPGRATSAGTLRNGPTASHAEIASFANGAAVRSLGINGRSFVRLGTRLGWMSTSRLALGSVIPTIPTINRINQALGRGADERQVTAITRIVIHHSANPTNGTHLNTAAFENTWRNLASMGAPNARGGYHEVVLSNGNMEINMQDRRRTWGAAGQNDHTWHICLTGQHANGINNISQTQLNSLANRIATAMRRFGWTSANVDRIVRHRDLPGQATACNDVNVANVRNAVRALLG